MPKALDQDLRDRVLVAVLDGGIAAALPLIDQFPPQECRNYFRNSGYVST